MKWTVFCILNINKPFFARSDFNDKSSSNLPLEFGILHMMMNVIRELQFAAAAAVTV